MRSTKTTAWRTLLAVLAIPTFASGQATYRGQCTWHQGGCGVVQSELVTLIGRALEDSPGGTHPAPVKFALVEPIEGFSRPADAVLVNISDPVVKDTVYLIFARRIGLRLEELREVCDSLLPIGEAKEALAFHRRRKREAMPASITVQLRDRKSDAALSGVRLRAWNGTQVRHATSGPKGLTEFDSLTPGEWRIDVEDSRYVYARDSPFAMTVSSGQCLDTSMSLNGKLSIAGRITGHDGSPVPVILEAEKELDGSAGVASDTSFSDGRFKLSGLETGCYFLWAWALGSGAPLRVFYPGTMDPSAASCVEAAPDGEPRLEFKLPDFGSERRAVITFAGLLPADGSVQLEDRVRPEDEARGPHGFLNEGITSPDRSGRLVLVLHSSLRYRFVFFTGSQERLESDVIEIEPGQEDLKVQVTFKRN